MKKSILLLMCFSLLISSCSDIQLASILNNSKSNSPLTNSEIIDGLKQALEVGTNNSTSIASKVDGFYKNELIRISMPTETAKMATKLRDLGVGNQVDQFEMAMNRAAEEACKEASSVFISAIKGMTIQDGIAILKGDNNAATQYLQRTTSSELTSKFTPIVNSAMQKVQVAKYWEPLASKYNIYAKLSGEKEVNPDLKGYIVDKSLNGLFTLIAKEEASIRENPTARVTDLLKKVFGTNL